MTNLNGYAYSTAATLNDLNELKLATFKALTSEIKQLTTDAGLTAEWKKAEFWALSQHNVTL